MDTDRNDIAAHAPLTGVRVVDFSRYLPGPFCAMQLAQLGADVVRVQQPPHGDPMRGMPVLDESGRGYASYVLERGTRTELADLNSTDDRARVVAMCAASDVVIESFRPGVADRLGIGADTLRAATPALVYCSLSGYGQDGPWAHAAGHDGNYEAIAGLVARSGTEHGPNFGTVPIADLAGGMFGATAICASLLRARATGMGAHIDIALSESALAFQPHLTGDTQTRRGRGLLQGDLACYRVYETAQGEHVALCALEPKFFARVLEILELAPQLAARQYDPASQDELAGAIQDAFLTRCADEWDGRFSLDETCLTKVLEPDAVAAHPQFVARDALDTIPSSPPVNVAASPYVIDGTRARA